MIVVVLMIEMGCKESHIYNSDNGIGVMQLDRYNQNKISKKNEQVNSLQQITRCLLSSFPHVLESLWLSALSHHTTCFQKSHLLRESNRFPDP